MMCTLNSRPLWGMTTYVVKCGSVYVKAKALRKHETGFRIFKAVVGL